MTLPLRIALGLGVALPGIAAASPPADAPVSVTPATFVPAPAPESIRDFDFLEYMLRREWDFLTDCPTRERLSLLGVAYGDLDHDGTEEAVVEIQSCWMGAGGADIVEVFKMPEPGRIRGLEITAETLSGEPIDLTDVYDGVQWTPRLGIEEGRLTRSWVMYPRRPEHPKSGWRRCVVYAWHDDQFVIDRVVTSPPLAN